MTYLPGIFSYSCYSSDPGIVKSRYLYELIASMNGDTFANSRSVSTIGLTPGQGTIVSDITGLPNTLFYEAKLANQSNVTDIPPLEQTSFTAGVPSSYAERLHLNLWLFQGAEPGPKTNSYEVVVSKFKFEPMDLSKIQPRLQLINVHLRTTYPSQADIDINLP